MNTFPLVDIFPIVTKSPNHAELARSAAMEQPWAPTTYADALEIGRCLAANRLNGTASNSAEDSLTANSTYPSWTKGMPDLRRVPAIRNYRNGRRESWDSVAVDAEIHAHGSHLPPGQIVFHGGIWRDGKTASVGDKLTFPHALSTSLLPQVAVSHTAKHEDLGSLWILTVASGASPVALAFKNRHTENLGHEYEVLVAGGAVVICVAWHATKPFSVIECSLA